MKYITENTFFETEVFIEPSDKIKNNNFVSFLLTYCIFVLIVALLMSVYIRFTGEKTDYVAISKTHIIKYDTLGATRLSTETWT